MDRLEGRNPVLECLIRERRKVHRIWMDRGVRYICISVDVGILFDAARSLLDQVAVD